MLYDLFTDTAGTTLTSHTADSGATWTLNPASSGTAVINTAGRLRTNAGLDDWYTASWTPASADYTVEADVYAATATGIAGVLARFSASVLTGYRFMYHQGLGGWSLDRLSGGAFVQIGSIFAQTLTAGQSYHIKLVVSGSSIAGYVDGVLRCSGTNTDIAAAGKAGAILSNWTGATNYTPGDAIGVQLDNLTAGGVLLAPTGLASAESLGAPALRDGAQDVSPTGVPSAEALGAGANLHPANSLAVTALASGEALGSLALDYLVPLTVTGVGSAETLGSPEVGQRRKLLGGYALVQALPQQSLGGEAYIRAASVKRLYCYAQVSRVAGQNMGGTAWVAPGPLLGGSARVQARNPALLGGEAMVVPPGAAPPAGGWFPREGRRLGQEETDYLQIVYKNYPLSLGQADLRWEWDGVVLPVNGAKLTLKEPVIETILETLGARVMSVIEEELDTPRTTRSRQFEIELPAIGIQFLQWLKARMRIGREFIADIRLFDVGGEEYWEQPYTDRSDALWAYKRYWGSLPYWKPGTVVLRVNGTIISDLPAAGAAYNPTLGFVEFHDARDPADLVEVQYGYAPVVRIMAVENMPQAGHAFTRFAPRITLKEMSARDSGYSETLPIATTPPTIPATWFDSFAQADGVRPLLETGQAWSSAGGRPPATVGNEGAGNASSDLYYFVDTGLADGLVEATMVKNGAFNWPSLIARWTDSSNYLVWTYSGFPARWNLVKVVAGVSTQIFAGGIGQIGTTPRLGLGLNGANVTVYIDGIRYQTISVPELTGTKHGFKAFDVERVDDFSFRKLTEIYPGYLPPDPNADWLTGNPIYDDWVKPDGGAGWLQTGQVWEHVDDFYPAVTTSDRLQDAHLGVTVAVGSAFGTTQWRMHQGTFGNPQVTVRWTDENNYVAFGVDAGSGLLKIIQAVGGVITTLATGPSWGVTAGNHGDLKLEITLANVANGYLNGSVVCSASGVTAHNTVKRVGLLLGSSDTHASLFSHTDY